MGQWKRSRDLIPTERVLEKSEKLTRLDIDSPMAVTESEIKVQDSGRKSEQTVIESQINARTVTEKGQNPHPS
jgi:hypothetical protein